MYKIKMGTKKNKKYIEKEFVPDVSQKTDLLFSIFLSRSTSAADLKFFDITWQTLGVE
jgi:hypothetical protein